MQTDSLQSPCSLHAHWVPIAIALEPLSLLGTSWYPKQPVSPLLPQPSGPPLRESDLHAVTVGAGSRLARGRE
jgi:hypothetical protein